MVKERILIFLLVSTLCAIAQHPVQPMPPYIAPIPEKICINKTFVYTTPAGPSTSHSSSIQGDIPLEINIMQTGDTRKEIWHCVNGTVIEKWRYQHYRFFTNPSNPASVGVHLERGLPEEQEQDLASLDEVSWVAMAFFHGEQQIQGRKCFVYKRGNETAWIDETSRLPIAYESARVRIAYMYPPAPAQALQLPQALMAKVKAITNAWSGH